MAQSASRPPFSFQSLRRPTTKRASSTSLKAAYREMGSPSAPSVHSSLPSRSELLAMTQLAAFRILAVER
ncbi:hypothetical protein D3C75_1220950 [compost metagenome]